MAPANCPVRFFVPFSFIVTRMNVFDGRVRADNEASTTQDVPHPNDDSIRTAGLEANIKISSEL